MGEKDLVAEPIAEGEALDLVKSFRPCV